MSFPWLDIDILVSSIGRQINQLENLRDTLFSANLENLRLVYSEEYCGSCRGFCSTKAIKLNHLRLLAERTEAVSISLIDLVHSKLYFQNLYAIPHLPASPSSLVLLPDSSENEPWIVYLISLFYEKYVSNACTLVNTL